MRLKHNTYIRNTYEFSLPYMYSFLEPMDIVIISTTSVWAQGLNDSNLGIADLPVRITKIVDDPADGLKIEAEDYPFGAGQPVIFNKGISQGEQVANQYADPGVSEVVMFEASGRVTGYTGNELWIGACGSGENYGATVVWVSQDNINFVKVTTIDTPAMLGTLAATFPSGSDPDASNSLVVRLAENCPALASATSAAADNLTTLCYVDGELIAYSASTATAQNTFTLGSYIRRGCLGTPVDSHATGSLFLRLDGSVFKYQYDPSWQGKTIYAKFQAVNNFGLNPQPLSNIASVSFTLSDTSTGVTQGSSSGLNSQGSIIPTQNVVLSTSYTTSSVTVTWSAQSMLRADNSTLAIPAGSYTWSNLASSTAYYIYPSIDPTSGVLGFTNPNPPTTSPSSTYALQAGMDGHIALPPYVITTSTPSSGGGGSPGDPGTGGGSTGGGDTCPEAAELVNVRGKGDVPAGSVLAGDFIRGRSFTTGEDIYRKVIRTEHIPSVAWRVVEGHRVSPCESVFYDGTWLPAYRVPGATPDTAPGTKVHLTVDTGDHDEANYYLASGQSLLIHNYRYDPC